jgi:hypothetical protein
MCYEWQNKVQAPQSRVRVDSIGSVDQLNGYAQCLATCNARHWSAVRDSNAARVKAVTETTCRLQTVVKSPAGSHRRRRRNAADAITSNHIRKRSAVSASPCLLSLDGDADPPAGWQLAQHVALNSSGANMPDSLVPLPIARFSSRACQSQNCLHAREVISATCTPAALQTISIAGCYIEHTSRVLPPHRQIIAIPLPSTPPTFTCSPSPPRESPRFSHAVHVLQRPRVRLVVSDPRLSTRSGAPAPPHT